VSQDEKSEVELEANEAEAEDESSGSLTYQINTYPADFTLEVLHQKWRNGDFEIPTFQRGFVWKQPQASKLIESFLLGLPVPPIFLYTARETSKQLVVDGQQRLRTIFYYFDGFFGEGNGDKRTVFRLRGLSDKSPLERKAFTELSEKDQRRLKDSVLRSIIIQQLDPEDDTSVYHVFERLNTGGTALSNQEVRNCVYRGKFTDLLKELNAAPEWRELVGTLKTDPRQKDVELILRFFSLQDFTAYRKPLKDFMSKSMRRLNKAAEVDPHALESLFRVTCKRVVDALGKKPFHITSGLNTAVFDSMMVGIAACPDATNATIRAMRDELLTDPDYKKAVRDATTDPEVLRKRMDFVKVRLGR
jgi:hypothetical protein